MTKHYDYHSEEDCHSSSEEECHYEQKHSYKPKSCGYKKPKKCPPNVAGAWITYEFEVRDGESIFNPTNDTRRPTLVQNGRFVTYTLGSGNTRLGVWQYNPISGWTLYFVQNGLDNDILILTPLKFKKNNVVKMDVINYEAGTNPSVPGQIAGVSYSTWIRTSNGNCYC